ncbi:variant 4, partial [Lathyrus oleraceus]
RIKRKAEEALLASGIPYTIVRPGGMERPTDAYKETHNVTLSTEDTLFGGQVSNLQVAELMAIMAKNPDLSYCKIVEVIAETTAPLIPAEKLLTRIPSQRPYISSPKVQKADTATVSNTGPSANVVAEVPSIAPQKETASKPVVKTEQPLSPYTAYDDLKPSSSPSPTKPSEKKQINISDAVPTPISSDTPSSIQEIDGISQTTSSSKGKESLSPYAAYPDLKPPSSPSPSVPTTSLLKIDTVVVSSNGPAQLSVEDTPKNEEQHLHEPKSRPLSPYAMYEDLKPPASPSPSFRKF